MIDNNRMIAKAAIKASDIILKKEVFSDQPRFTIMFLLYLNRKIGTVELQRLLELTPGNLDHHLKTLEKANLISIKKKITWRPLNVVIITTEGIEAFRNYALHLKELLKDIF